MSEPVENAPEFTHIPTYDGEFLRVIIGSTIHGLSIADTDDLDLMGVRIERPTESIGLGKPFEQYVWRTQPEGQPSGPGDVDLTVYSLRKYMRLAANGNPTVLNLLFVPPESRHIDQNLACELRGLIPLIVSKEAAARYIGYLRQQRERLIGERGQKRSGYSRREKYIAEDGWDTKYAMHMCRLGVQGVELLQTGRITLPVPEPYRSMLMEVRQGKVTMQESVYWAEKLESELKGLANSADLPEHPDREALDQWMIEAYLDEWA